MSKRPRMFNSPPTQFQRVAGAGVRTFGKGLGAVMGTDAYQGTAASLSQRADFSLTYGSIVLITALAASYLVVASLGIDTFTKKCKELAGVKTQENPNKWLVATLAIAITIPFTLLVVKLSGPKLSALMMLLFAILGIVASSAVIHWNRKCETPDSEKIYGGINMAVFIVMLIVGGFMLRYRGFRNSTGRPMTFGGAKYSGPMRPISQSTNTSFKPSTNTSF